MQLPFGIGNVNTEFNTPCRKVYFVTLRAFRLQHLVENYFQLSEVSVLIIFVVSR